MRDIDEERIQDLIDGLDDMIDEAKERGDVRFVAWAIFTRSEIEGIVKDLGVAMGEAYAAMNESNALASSMKLAKILPSKDGENQEMTN